MRSLQESRRSQQKSRSEEPEGLEWLEQSLIESLRRSGVVPDGAQVVPAVHSRVLGVDPGALRRGDHFCFRTYQGSQKHCLRVGWYDRRLDQHRFVMWDLRSLSMRNQAFADTYDFAHLDQEAIEASVKR